MRKYTSACSESQEKIIVLGIAGRKGLNVRSMVEEYPRPKAVLLSIKELALQTEWKRLRIRS